MTFEMETEAAFVIHPTWNRLFLASRNNLGISLLLIILCGLLYYLLGLLSPYYRIDALAVPLVWLPSGLALVVVLLAGYRFALVALLGMALLAIQQGLPQSMVLGVVIGATLQAFLPALLLRMFGFNPRLERIRDVMLFVGMGGLFGPFLAASAGVVGLSNSLPGGGALLQIWLVWWLANSLGCLIITGFLLVWVTTGQEIIPAKNRLSLFLLLCGATAATLLGFIDTTTGQSSIVLFAVIPLTVFAALYCGRQGVTVLAMGALVAVMILMTSAPPHLQEASVLVNMTFNLGLIWMASFTGLVVAAAYSEQGAGDRYAYLAQHDGLTRLINRSTFEQRLEQAIQHAKREGRPQVHALMFIDLDDFKLINDQFGHATGDLVLRSLSDLLLSHVRSRDTVARLGGDEFVVLLENCSADCSRLMAERIATAIRGMLIPVENGNCQITASIGVTPIGDNTGTLASVLSAADAAHYQAKDEGKNQVHYRYVERVTDEC